MAQTLINMHTVFKKKKSHLALKMHTPQSLVCLSSANAPFRAQKHHDSWSLACLKYLCLGPVLSCKQKLHVLMLHDQQKAVTLHNSETQNCDRCM